MAIDIDAYLEKARQHLESLNSAHDESWGLNSAGSYTTDPDTGLLHWNFSDRVAVAPYQVVGTYNTSAETFQWSWANPSIAPSLAEDAKTVLAFAKQYQLDFLEDAELGCPERGAWDLAALATGLCKRQGMYRSAEGDQLIYMTFGSVQLTPISQAS